MIKKPGKSMRHSVIRAAFLGLIATGVLLVNDRQSALAKDFTQDHPPPPSLTCSGDTIVWINTKTCVYHLRGMTWYGHTKEGNGQESEVYGYNESSLIFYWAVCHDTIVKDAFKEGTRLGRRLGYHFTGELPSQTNIKSPLFYVNPGAGEDEDWYKRHPKG